jgi:hypothetical protein
MNPLLIGPLAELIKSVVNKIWPDPAQQAEAQLRIATLMQTGELAQLAAETGLMQGQIDINKIEAAGEGTFKAGWRPFIGWTCGAGFAWQFVAQPAAEWISAALGHPIALPHADMSQMMPVLLGMLGLGGLRTMEKIKGQS